MERRWCERIAISAQAYVFLAGRYIPVELRNVSLEGALVRLTSGVFEPEEWRIELVIEESGKVCIPAEVTHYDEQSLGLAFHYQDQSDFRAIRDLWARHAPQDASAR